MLTANLHRIFEIGRVRDGRECAVRKPGLVTDWRKTAGLGQRNVWLEAVPAP